MSPILTITRRELAAMFRSPLAYVFLVLFVGIVHLSDALTFFVQQQADLRSFFDFLPWCIVVFASLVTMRSWAEERQDNTYEMLLTFPMRDRHLVIGKWLAAFAFLSLGIVLTSTSVAMAYGVGSPDHGPIVAGYLGALLLAAASTAAGVFFSGLTRSQLLAALLSFVSGFVALLAGTEIVAALVDAPLGGVGTTLRSTIGAWTHYAVFTRGVVELNDALFFIAWTVVFLHLNTIFLTLRRIAGSWPSMALGTALGLGCGMLSSLLVAEGSLARADLTEDKLYTLSPGTLAILSQAKVPVRVKYYVSPKDEMPSQMKSIEREVVDRMNEISVASHGKLQFSVVHMNVQNISMSAEEEAALDGEEDGEGLTLEGAVAKKEGKDDKKLDEVKKKLAEKEKSLERRLLDKGVKPFTVQSFEATQASSKLVYSTIGIAYREKDEEFLPPVQPNSLSDLEYLLANTVAKITRAKPPKVALVVVEEPMDPQLKMMYQRMGQRIPEPPFEQMAELLRREKYDVAKVKLTAQEPLPEDYDALVVVGPANLDERQKWEISRAIAEGRPTLLALQRFTWKYSAQGRNTRIEKEEADPGLDDLLAANGLGVARDILMDASHRALNVPTGTAQDIFGGWSVKVPMHVWVTRDSMNSESALTQRLSSILYLWGSSLEVDKAKLSANDLRSTVLLSTSEKSWLVPASRPLKQNDLTESDKDLKPRPIAVLVEGKLKDPAAETPRPNWPPRMEMGPDGRPVPAMPDGPERPAVPGSGKLILTGCARMWQDGFVGTGGLGNGMFLLNCVDALTLDENLLLVRSKQPTDRSFERPSTATAVLWTLVPFLFLPLAIIGTGGVIAMLRYRRRDRWNQAHGRNA